MPKTDRRQVECDSWHGLYRQGWGKNRLRPASFAHPAKNSYGLSVRIYEHALEEGWIKLGDYLVDCFAGVGGFALEAMRHGLHFVGCELEQRFVDMGQGCDCTGISKADWVRFQGRWDRVRYEGGRHWCPQCLMKAGAVTNERKFKPLPLPGTKWAAIAKTRQATLFDLPAQAGAAPSASYVRNSGKIPCTGTHHYRGNIETWEAQGMAGSAVIVQGDSRRLGEVLERASLCLSSPPYGGNVKSDRTHERRDERRLGIGFTGRGRGCFRGSETYGQTAGNLGSLPDTGFEAVLDPPGYTVTPKKPARAIATPQATLEGAGQPVLALSSPPWRQTEASNTAKTRSWVKEQIAAGKLKGHNWGDNATLQSGYGTEPGQLAQMPEGDLVAVISSPPFQGSLSRDNVTEGRIALAREKGISVHLVSPVDMEKIGKRTQNYDAADGQLAALPEGSHAAACERPVCCVSSPPYIGTPVSAQGADGKSQEWNKAYREYQRTGNHVKFQAQMTKKCDGAGYGSEAGPLGQETGSTFWAASREILEQVYQVLAPGGHAIWVLKMFVRSGRLVDFPGQWEALCQSVGFRTVCKHRAWLNKNTGIMQSTLDGDEVSMAKWYKSFFRILCESKGSPRIDWELILCMEKPR